MKKIISLLVLTIVNLLALTQSFEAQEKSKDNFTRTLEVRLEKSNYVLFEPLFAKFKYTHPSTDGIPCILQTAMMKVNFQGTVREFPSLSTSQGCPQALPSRNKMPEYITREEEGSLAGVESFFPQPGNYKIQFFLYGATSELIDVTIEEPAGIDREALNFLNKYENPLSFYWVFTEKDGITQLQTFVNKFSESAYGEIAAYQLGLTYFNKGEFDKAKIEFEKLRNGKNKFIARNAVNSLRDVEENIKIRKRTELTKNN